MDPVDASHGDDHASAGLELLHQGGRNESGGGGDDDGIEWCFFLPAVVAVGMAGSHPVEPEPPQAISCAGRQNLQDLDRVHVATDVPEHGGLIARSGTHLQDLHSGLRSYHLGHVGYDIGLGDGLAQPDRKRLVTVGPVPVSGGYELVPRHVAHGVKGRRIGDAVGDDSLHHLPPPLAESILKILAGQRPGKHTEPGQDDGP